ncbi:site-specific DNA-methyltransferase [Empedobacter sedimenti]|uniref:site-specific DNA-methyltransferase n=1 Tax=Empedobacter sedimenti TaxID=3042610 RepID=UPI0024A626D9|nr:DNA methyltransferase [Empedobacter sedimenti]
MSNYNKLQDVLKEIFEMDKADLDFGIYRIMNQKRDQVMDFIDRKLPKDIKDILAQTQSKDSTSIQAELDKAIKSAQDLGVEPDTLPKVIELKAQLNNAIDTNALEQEVFSHLANFFKRYYKDGDFISLRRYKKDVYAIPYEGEEVKLHWANHDQYYIKTSEYLKNYSFKLKDGKSVHFQLKEASTEQNNNKAQGDQERRFAIYEEQPVEVIDGQLYINFTYEPHKKTVKQADLEAKAIEVIQNNIPAEFALAFDKAPTEKNKNRTIVEKHLNDFISRNSFDYFIHKDLGGFLRRELDFYIKNEVLYIDDINTENPAYFTAQLSKIKALKTVASKIITFLAQIEDFQKKLWLKKKFVISTHYCITLDRIPEKYYAEIVANQAQLDEWKELFDIVIPNGSEESLRNEPYLVLDTKHFSEEFKDKLLAEFDNLDEETNGLLINSENFQALNVLQEKYQERISLNYIDPPYNTSASEILYLNGFKSASWMSLIENRELLSKKLLSNSAVKIVAIDDTEFNNISFILREVHSDKDINNVIVNHHPAGAGLTGTNISTTHEYAIFLTPKNKKVLFGEKKEAGIGKIGFIRTGTAESNLRIGRPNSFYAVLVDSNYNVVGIEVPPKINESYPEENTVDGLIRIYPKSKDGTERVWRRSYESCLKEIENNNIICSPNLSLSLISDNEESSKPIFSNWTDTKYNAGVHGTNVLTNIIGKPLFSYPKSIYNLYDCIYYSTNLNSLILDYFAGSGTTGHATIKLNREDGGNRKYILVEMGTYFNTVTKPRIQKVIYTDNWKNGKPQDKAGISQLFKYQVLESYEDALNNLQLPNKTNAALLNFEEQAQEEYLLNYMLDVETQDHLFNVQMFRNPFNYQLKVTENNELVPTKVDLVETFNYLIGLYVERVQRVGDIKFVEGKTREGIKTLVIWRNLETTSNEETAQRFRKIYDSVRSSEFDQIYINGDHHFDNMRTGEDNFKVKLIEETFFKQMFNISEL